MKARTIHEGKAGLGAPLTNTFHKHLDALRKSDSKNPEVQNRYDQAVKRDRARTGPDISFSGNEADPLFYNTGSGFVEIGTTLGLGRVEDGRGMVLVDVDGDGAQDVVVHNYFRNPIVALHNRAAGEGRWVRLRLRGRTSNRFGIGAKVTVNGRLQELACGAGYLSGNAPELHFGLGPAAHADVAVRWPSGKQDEYKALPVNRIHTMVEGEAAALRSEELVRHPIAPAVPDPAPPELDVRALMKGLRTLEGEPAAVDGTAVVVFFSVSCHACIQDLQQMVEHEQRARERGLRLVWVTIDRDLHAVGEEFRVNKAPSLPLRPTGSVAGLATPTVYRITPDRVEKFTGRF
ncbi:MAG TPA: ASPIC/UnbV domain-containing protein, partial [Candidatus Polarisedimenticolia bacterium]|nr:ASPIC/UnbV domain-containing protein [Candidatus Polarisedimenticolia bacterium]